MLQIADYDDTALGTGTLTVHPWRAGPDCGKLYYIQGRKLFKGGNYSRKLYGM